MLLDRRIKQLLSTFSHVLREREGDLVKQNRKAVAPAGCQHEHPSCVRGKGIACIAVIAMSECLEWIISFSLAVNRGENS